MPQQYLTVIFKLLINNYLSIVEFQENQNARSPPEKGIFRITLETSHTLFLAVTLASQNNSFLLIAIKATPSYKTDK